MDIKENELVCLEREFGFSLVKWEIKNYFAATCQKNWIICSPTFGLKAKVFTKWQLSLQAIYKFEKYSVFMFLERQECDPFTDVHVSWKLSYPYSKSEMKLEGDSEFGNRKFVGIEMCDLDVLDKMLLIKDNDSIIIRFLMIVYPKDSKMCSRPKDKGLKSLSQDLMVLYRLNKNHDIEIHVNGMQTKVHKAVLSSRNKVLRDAIEYSNIIDLPDLDFEATKQVFGYLYTGNLNYVLRRPSFSILDCIKYLQIKELESYYECDKLTLVTSIDVKEYTFNWEIHDKKFSNVAYLLSPLFKANELHLTFRLYFYPRRFKKKYGNVVVFLDVVEGSFPQSAHVELIISESFSKCKYIQRMRLSSTNEASTGFEIIFPRNVEDLRLAIGQIIISCTIKSLKGSESFSMESNAESKILIDSEQHFELLSDQIASLFETGRYSDFTLMCRKECFQVHSYILCTRSHIFRRIFEKIKLFGSRTFEVSSIRSSVLRALLFNVYSGKIIEHEIPDVFKIYKAAERFCLFPLKYSCSNILQNNINAENAWFVFHLADRYKDHKLKSVVLKFVRAISEEYLNEIEKRITSE